MKRKTIALGVCLAAIGAALLPSGKAHAQYETYYYYCTTSLLSQSELMVSPIFSSTRSATDVDDGWLRFLQNTLAPSGRPWQFDTAISCDNDRNLTYLENRRSSLIGDMANRNWEIYYPNYTGP